MGGAASISDRSRSNDNSNELMSYDATDASISGLAAVPPWMKALQIADEQARSSMLSQQSSSPSLTSGDRGVLSSESGIIDVKLQVLRVPVFEKHPTADFRLLHNLGEGAFSMVYKAELKQNSFIRLAIKEIDMDRLQQRKLTSLGKEMNILSQLHHPAIVDLFGVYKTTKKVFLIMEYLKGGELIPSNGPRSPFSEPDARRVMLQLVDALQYLHRRKVIHRDIKPANLMLVHRGVESPVKIIDFGFAMIEPSSSSSDVAATSKGGGGGGTILCGTPGYLAPEVINSRLYTSKVDIWCLGVVLYLMLSAIPPFTADPAGEIRSLNGEFSFPDSVFQHVSSSAKNLIRRMFVLDPLQRISAAEILAHPWMVKVAKAKSGGGSGITSPPLFLKAARFLHYSAGGDAEAGEAEHGEQEERQLFRDPPDEIEKNDDDDDDDDDASPPRRISNHKPSSLRIYYPPSPSAAGGARVSSPPLEKKQSGHGNDVGVPAVQQEQLQLEEERLLQTTTTSQPPIMLRTSSSPVLQEEQSPPFSSSCNLRQASLVYHFDDEAVEEEDGEDESSRVASRKHEVTTASSVLLLVNHEADEREEENEEEDNSRSRLRSFSL